MIDSRLKAVIEDIDESLSGTPKALWDPVNLRLYVSTKKQQGV